MMTADEAIAYLESYNVNKPWFDPDGRKLFWEAHDTIRIEREAHEAAAKSRPKTYTELRFAEFVARNRGK